MVGFFFETDDDVYIRGFGDGDPGDVEWDQVLRVAWRVMCALRGRGIPAVGMAIVDLEARIR
jgi:hypothetical protein